MFWRFFYKCVSGKNHWRILGRTSGVIPMRGELLWVLLDELVPWETYEWFLFVSSFLGIQRKTFWGTCEESLLPEELFVYTLDESLKFSDVPEGVTEGYTKKFLKFRQILNETSRLLIHYEIHLKIPHETILSRSPQSFS